MQGRQAGVGGGGGGCGDWLRGWAYMIMQGAGRWSSRSQRVQKMKAHCVHRTTDPRPKPEDCALPLEGKAEWRHTIASQILLRHQVTARLPSTKEFTMLREKFCPT